jgi:hypothetical protein
VRSRSSNSIPESQPRAEEATQRLRRRRQFQPLIQRVALVAFAVAEADPAQPCWVNQRCDGRASAGTWLACRWRTAFDDARLAPAFPEQPQALRKARGGRHGRLSAVVVLRHSDDDVALLVSLVDIPMRLGDLFQRIAPIDDRFYLSRLNELFEEDETFGLLA